MLFHQQLHDYLHRNPVNYHLHRDWLISAAKKETLSGQHTVLRKFINDCNHNDLSLPTHYLILIILALPI